jgi:hypothetical protein
MSPAPETPLKTPFAKFNACAFALLMPGAVLAQTATTVKPGAKPPVKQTRPAARAPAPKVLPVDPPLAKAEGEQLAAAAMTHFGDYACEFDQSVNVNVTPNNDGYVDVRFKTQTWTMKPILSSTGALRLEDVKGRMLMLQIANKSMLMDTQIGQRVLDGCVHEKQRIATAAAAAAAASQPATESLLQGSAAASAPK